MTYMVIAYVNHCIRVWVLRGGEFGVVLSSFSFSEFTSNLEIFRFVLRTFSFYGIFRFFPVALPLVLLRCPLLLLSSSSAFQMPRPRAALASKNSKAATTAKGRQVVNLGEDTIAQDLAAVRESMQSLSETVAGVVATVAALAKKDSPAPVAAPKSSARARNGGESRAAPVKHGARLGEDAEDVVEVAVVERGGEVNVVLPPIPLSLKRIGFPLSVAHYLLSKPRANFGIECFQARNFQAVQHRIEKELGSSGEGKAPKCLSLVMSASVFVFNKSDFLELVAALHMWAQVQDWVSQGVDKEAAQEHMGDVLSLALRSPQGSSVPYHYDNLRREAWACGSGTVAFGSRDEAALDMAKTMAANEARGKRASDWAEGPSAKRAPPPPERALVASGKPPLFCFDFNSPAGCSRSSCRFEHACASCFRSHSASTSPSCSASFQQSQAKRGDRHQALPPPALGGAGSGIASSPAALASAQQQ